MGSGPIMLPIAKALQIFGAHESIVIGDLDLRNFISMRLAVKKFVVFGRISCLDFIVDNFLYCK
jgi:hypothetical protein